MINSLKKKIKYIALFYNDLKLIRESYPRLVNTLTTLALGCESNRIAITSIAKELDDEQIMDLQNEKVDENFIN